MPIDYKKYPENWLSEIRPRIMDRAKGCCEICGLKHGQIVFAIKLTVKDDSGRYKIRSLWFSNKSDAQRECPAFREVKSVMVILTVAHLDHDEINHEVTDERLKALCQLCHLRYDAKEKYRRSLINWKE